MIDGTPLASATVRVRLYDGASGPLLDYASCRRWALATGGGCRVGVSFDLVADQSWPLRSLDGARKDRCAAAEIQVRGLRRQTFIA